MADPKTAQPIRIYDEISDVNVSILNGSLYKALGIYLTDGNNFVEVGSGTKKTLLSSIHDGDNLLSVALNNNTAPTSGLIVFGVDPTGKAQYLSTDTSGVLNVNIKSSAEPNPVHDFKKATGILAGNSDSHTYTSTGDFKLARIMCSARGEAKWEVKVGPTGSEVTKAVKFTSPSKQECEFSFDVEIPVNNGDNVIVTATNLERVQAQDMYSTIIGYYQ
jgi:hypothetical protein